MPAAAVIPAPIAYIKVVAVKKLVVGFLSDEGGPHSVCASACVGHLPECRRRYSFSVDVCSGLLL